VPQELATDMFETVWSAVAYSQGLFGKPYDGKRLEEILKSLSLWDKKDAQIRALSGGMKRRVLIAKALAHDPELLFLDEPTAGVDVELRKDMWQQIAALKQRGVTIILTTHYIEEAEEMADRVGIIQGGRILMVDEKRAMMERLGTTEAVIDLAAPLHELPPAIAAFPVEIGEGGARLIYRGGNGQGGGRAEVAQLAQALTRAGIGYTSLDIHDSSLEDIFVGLLGEPVLGGATGPTGTPGSPTPRPARTRPPTSSPGCRGAGPPPAPGLPCGCAARSPSARTGAPSPGSGTSSPRPKPARATSTTGGRRATAPG
jgi:ABC-2 type transport system ATP-binding protein